MKLVKTAFPTLIILLTGVGCLKDPDTGDTGTTGAAGSSGVGAGGNQGAMATGGAGATTGGTMNGTAGTSSGGSAAGGSETGGAATGGAVGGSETGGGAMGGSAMGGGAMGGSAMGASAMGGSAMGGSGTMGGGGAGGAGGTDELDPDTLIPGLDGLFMAYRATNPDDPGDSKYWLSGNGEDCPVGDTWDTSGVTRENMYQVMGTPGQKYIVDFELRGALALRCYTGGTPSGMAADPMGVNEAFYVGGEQFGDSPLNTLQLAVTPEVADEPASVYFLNGIPSTSDMCDAQISYDVGYAGQFVIMGDSTITISTHASDCQVPQNCGADPTAGCDPRTVDVSGLQVKASPMQPIFDYLGGVNFYPQWFVFDIKTITLSP